MKTITNISCQRRQGNASAKRHVPPLKYYRGEFVLNLETGMFYRVTPVAISVLKGLEGGNEIESLAKIVQAESGVDHVTAVRDVELLINELAVRGILAS